MVWIETLSARKVCRIVQRAEPGHRAVVEEFEKWLREVRCLAPATVAIRVQFVDVFLKEMVGSHDVESTISQLTSSDVESFFIEQAKKYSVQSRRCLATTLRQLLHFTSLRGWSDSQLVASVPPVFSYRLSSLPEGISEANIDHVLDALKPDSTTRCRDRAILLLLATYGPRTGQISELRLSDLAWRKKQITFCAQKRSKAVTHVLTPAVAESIALYLREHRPEVNHDHVLVLGRRPLSPMGPSAIRGVVKYRLQSAGVGTGPFSPRAFRYAVASRLVNAGQPYHLIADVFGHRSPRATAVYTKMNLPVLTEAAAEWQEVIK